jgi:hypothetical protein
MTTRTHSDFSPSDFKGLQDWVPIFRAGVQKDSLGREKVWTTGDLDQVVANHSAEHPAPHVITHKELYSPFAYGRTAELKREGDVLLAKSKDIEPQFEQLIKDGRLFERSVRLVPTANGWKLGHVAWLGAEQPAVQGLAPVQFSAEPAACDYSLEWRTPGLLARMMRRMREFMIEKFDMETADRLMPEWDINDLETYAADARAENQPAVPSFSEAGLHNAEASFTAPTTHQGDTPMPHSDEDLQRARDAARAEAQAEFQAQQATLQQQLDNERTQRLRAEFTATINEAIDAGRLTPAQAEGAVEFMLQLSCEPAEVEFSSGDTTVKKARVSWFSDFIAALPKQVDVGGERGGDDVSAAQAEFAAPAGYAVDASSAEIDRKARAYMAEHKTDYKAAVAAVTAR